MMKNVKVILLAGGRGERLWPYSNTKKPKPFSVFLNGKTLFQHTLERVSFLQPEQIYICTEKKLKKYILQQAPLFLKKNIICEPIGKDTAASIFLSNLVLKKSEDVLVFLPCDHFIKNKKEFQKTIEILIRTAIEKKSICLIGIPPKNPSTEFGYIQANESINTNFPFCFSIKKFHEKPDIETAKKYIQQKKNFWNSGIFACVHSILDKICNSHDKNLYSNLQDFLKKPLKYPFKEKIEKNSFDKKVLEKNFPLFFIEASFDWDDVGNWNSIQRYFPKDENQNHYNSASTFYDSNNVFCFNTEKKLVVIQGCEELSIINQKNILYIFKKDSPESIKNLLKLIQKDNPEYL